MIEDMIKVKIAHFFGFWDAFNIKELSVIDDCFTSESLFESQENKGFTLVQWFGILNRHIKPKETKMKIYWVIRNFYGKIFSMCENKIACNKS